MQSPKNNSQLHPVLTVTQLTNQLRDTLENAFQHVYVVGEVSNAKVYPSGHWYFSLKDKDSTLSCVCFKSSNSMLKFKLEDGLMVVARGKMNVYPPKGTYQLVANQLEPVGIGEWQLAFEQLRTKLEQEGLLHPDRKQPIPILPRRIGVVTSPVGAAIRDVLSALYRRNKNVNVVIAPVKVQGDGSAEEIAAAIDHLHRIPNIDVIIVARGGGSIEDLWAFNTEVVARAVADSAIPIISGVGHETDVTICDLAADLRAPTPTAAAELVAKGSAEIREKWTFLNRQLGLRTQAHLSDARARLEKLKPLHVLLRYSERLKRNRQKINHLRERMERSISHSLDRANRRWRQRDEKLGALGPLNVLARGFAIIRDSSGHIVRDPLDVSEGDTVSALLKSGELFLRVDKQPTVQPVNDPLIKDNSELAPVPEEPVPATISVAAGPKPGTTAVAAESIPGTTAVAAESMPGTTAVAAESMPGTTAVAAEPMPGATAVPTEPMPDNIAIIQALLPNSIVIPQELLPDTIAVHQAKSPDSVAVAPEESSSPRAAALSTAKNKLAVRRDQNKLPDAVVEYTQLSIIQE